MNSHKENLKTVAAISLLFTSVAGVALIIAEDYRRHDAPPPLPYGQINVYDGPKLVYTGVTEFSSVIHENGHYVFKDKCQYSQAEARVPGDNYVFSPGRTSCPNIR
ncbi:MAG: hypothetical protein HYU57_07465 [Micavibrio aeruginosavorus]|nr:hypothetical protein [Micavibrio aeruginosavorus]